MEHYLAAGLRDIEALLSTEEKRGEVGRRRQQLRQECPELLDIPLGVKLPLLPGSNPVFYRTKLGEKLHQPSSYFNLGDPHSRLLSSEYKSLHDPHLRNYYYRKDNLRRLRRGGYITKDDKVVCNLREFNQYRQYLTTLKITADTMYHGEQKMLREQLAKLKTVPELPHGTDISHLREWLLWEQRESLKAAEQDMRIRYLTMTAEHLEEPEAPEDDECLPAQADQDQDQKPLTEEHHEVPQTPLTCAELTEDQELDELAESMLEEVLGTLKAPDPSVHILRRSPLTISGSLFASVQRTEPFKTLPPDLQQEVGEMARELAAALLDRLGKQGAFSPSDAAEPRQRQQPISTRAGKSGESRANQAEAAGDRTSSLPSLDQIPTKAVENVGATLESFVASEFEHFQCKFTDRWKPPLDAASKRQPQSPQAHVSTQVTKEGKAASSESEYWTSEARRLPLLQPLQSASALSRESSRLARRSIQDAISKAQHFHADLKAYAEMVICDALDTLRKEKKKLEKEMHAKARSSEDTSEESSDESMLVDQVLEQCGYPLPAGASGLSCGRRVTTQSRPRNGEESSLGQGFLNLEEKKIPAKKLRKRQHGTKLPPITVPGMVMPSEEAQFSEELSPPLFPSILRGSERDAESPQ